MNSFARKQWCDNWIKPQWIELDQLGQISGLRTRVVLKFCSDEYLTNGTKYIMPIPSIMHVQCKCNANVNANAMPTPMKIQIKYF